MKTNNFEQWQIPESICNQYPIDQRTLGEFIGREAQIQELLKMVSTKGACCIIEGPAGVGKTSFGNFIRFRSTQFTPTVEIKTEASWDSKDLIANIIFQIAQELAKDSRGMKILKEKQTKIIIQRYADFDSSSSWDVGVQFLGNGPTLGMGKSLNFDKDRLHSSQVENDFKHILGVIEQTFRNTPVIIQLNNLDLGKGFQPEEMMKFLNSIREIVMTSGCSWILAANPGLTKLLKSKNMDRVGGIIQRTVYLAPLSFDEVKRAFQARIAGEGMIGVLPIEDEVLAGIYKSTNGNFREILKMVQQLLWNFQSKNEASMIKMEQASDFFYELNLSLLQDILKKKHYGEILSYLKFNEGPIQSQIINGVKKLEKTQASKILSHLCEIGVLRLEQTWKTKQYYLCNDFWFSVRSSNFNFRHTI
jgi:DNA transposition AAA+ family ATPase